MYIILCFLDRNNCLVNYFSAKRHFYVNVKNYINQCKQIRILVYIKGYEKEFMNDLIII